MSSPQQLLTLARRVSTVGITTLTGWTTYKAHTDPIHIFWDLDHTILCSVTPLPPQSPDASQNSSSILKPPTIDHFDQIDDDFPYNAQTLTPNTRTYFRPGAKSALWLCSKFIGTNHVYTAAQESYTWNILNELDPNRELFKGYVVHRTEFPNIVREGKDLTVVMGSSSSATTASAAAAGDNDEADTSRKKNEIRLERAILFDDKVSNFRPQNYENGVSVVPFTAQRLSKCVSTNNSDRSSSASYGEMMDNWEAYLDEVKEMVRLVGISVWSTVHLSGDVRRVVGWVRKFSDRSDKKAD